MMDTVLLQPCMFCECDVAMLRESKRQVKKRYMGEKKEDLIFYRRSILTVKPNEKEDFTAAAVPGGRGANKQEANTLYLDNNDDIY